MANYFLIDIGGTTIKYGISDGSGRFVEKGLMKNPARETSVGDMLSEIIGRIRAAEDKLELSGVAIATAGVVDTETGRIAYASDNIPNYTGTELGRIVGEAAHLPVVVENDTNAAALGEYWLGAGRLRRGMTRQPSPFFVMTLGTGVGGAIVIDGHVLHGASGFAGEVGFMTVGDEKFEDVAATSALIKHFARMKDIDAATVDGQDIFALARAHDETAVRAIDTFIKNLARGIANICYCLNPEMVIIGGAISAEAGYLKPRLIAALKALVVPRVYENMTIDFSRLGNDAGMLGALYHFKKKFNNG